MVPNVFEQVSEIPLMPNGKVDRGALARMGERLAETGEYEAPRNGIEAELADLWQELLEVERVGVGDNFFDLGGHSLLATQLVSRIRDRFGVTIEVRRLFESPTLGDLAGVVAQKQAQLLDEADLLSTLAELESLSNSAAQDMLFQAPDRDID
jgi:acyl carrier protein